MKQFKGITLLLLTILGLTNVGYVNAQSDELLPPEQAFALSAWITKDNLILEYQIAPGYYMYRKRFAFEVESQNNLANTRLDNPIMPDGKIKNDEFFGDMEVYRDSLRIVLPIIFDQPRTSMLKVKVTGQGCADIGVCYPPLVQTLLLDTASSSVVLPTPYQAPQKQSIPSNISALQSLLTSTASSTQSNTSSTINLNSDSNDALSQLQSLGEQIGLSGDDEIPHPDSAFMLSAKMLSAKGDQNQVIQFRIIIAPNTYLYRDKTKAKLVDGTGYSLGDMALPKGEEKHDEFLGQTEVFHGLLETSIPIIAAANASDTVTLSYQYQGCVEDRICYPPITKYLTVNLNDRSILINDEYQTSHPASSVNRVVEKSEQDGFAELLNDVSVWSILLFFLAGIGLTFTPCVFPMVPILSSIIAGQGESITPSKAFTLSLVYVLSMAATYAIVGAIVGYYGAEFNIQIWFQNPIVLGVFAAIFALLALSMFGFYDIQMPTAIQNRLNDMSNSQQGGNLIGVGLMGIFSAIIVGPCITAPLVGALIYISQTQNWQLGGIALFALGLGMGVPLLIIGTSAGSLLPRAGSWMDAVKSVFGVVLLGVAIWLLERVLPVAITMALIAILLITSAIFMGALEKLDDASAGWAKLKKGIGILLLLYGSAYLIGAVSGSQDLLQPLRGIVGNSTAPQAQAVHLQFRQIKGQQGLQLALADSIKQQRTSMLDFYADWCISCKEMGRYAFTHPGVIKALAQVNSLQTDVTANDSIDTALMASLGIYGPPAILFFDTDGNEIKHRRVVGEMSGEAFAAHVIATFNH